MNDHEAERIAAAMHQLRPDWPASSLLTLIRKNLIDRPRRDVIVALGWIASEPASHTPARVLESGPWWRAAGVETPSGPSRSGQKPPWCANCGQGLEATIHRFPNGECKFTDRPEVIAEEERLRRIAELKAAIVPTAGPTERRTLEDMAAANPVLHARVEAVRAANPGLAAPSLRETETEPATEGANG